MLLGPRGTRKRLVAKNTVRHRGCLNGKNDGRLADHAAFTACARIFTPRRLRTTPKIAARLSMLGLPRSDSIRWRLLLGVLVSTASASNPTEAFTRSRKIRRAACGSPFKNSVAASSSSALAKAGSRATRALTVSLKSRVSATLLPLAFGPGSYPRRLPSLVFG